MSSPVSAPLRVFGHVFLCETDLPVESLKLQECEVKQCKLMTEDEVKRTVIGR